MTTCALVIATYNRPDALALVLEGALLQTRPPDEILIADDGSDNRTKAVIDRYRARFNQPLLHIWHEDEGFRLAAIRNKAIAAASSAYIVQIDGDVLMHPYFIQDHLAFSRKGTLVRASRIYLDEKLTNEKLENNNPRVVVSEKGVSNKTSALRFPLIWPLFETRYKNSGLERWEIHGCNMAFFRDDLIQVNGYNEDFEGWGYEDKELVARLLRAGFTKRFLKMGAIVFHLHHELHDRGRDEANFLILRNTIDRELTTCSNGINKYLPVTHA